MRSPSRMLPQPWEVILAAAPASLAESLSKQDMMQFSLMEISQNSCVHSAFEAEEAKLGRDFRAAPIPWAHHRHRPNLLLLMAASNQQT